MTLDESGQEITHWWPFFLPDGNRFLYMARSSLAENTDVSLASIAFAAGAVLSRAELSRGPAGDEYLVFASGPSLMGQPFDAAHGRITGEPFSIADLVPHAQYVEPLHAPFATSGAGVLAYISERPLGQLTWFRT